MPPTSKFGPIRESVIQERIAKGNYLRSWLTQFGYDERSFAKRCGVSQRAVNQWLLGDRKHPVLLPVVLSLLEREQRDE